ncbi:MAG: PTS sugar transporter subunit IIB [Bacillota bacterium]
MKIICICGMGLGSSVIAKMNIENVLENLGVEAQVDTCDIGSIRSVEGNLYVTTRELEENLPDNIKDKTVVLTNFVKKDEIEEIMEPIIKKIKNNS